MIKRLLMRTTLLREDVQEVLSQRALIVSQVMRRDFLDQMMELALALPSRWWWERELHKESWVGGVKYEWDVCTSSNGRTIGMTKQFSWSVTVISISLADRSSWTWSKGEICSYWYTGIINTSNTSMYNSKTASRTEALEPTFVPLLKQAFWFQPVVLARISWVSIPRPFQ